MTASFWMSFRIARDEGYQDRYDSLIEEISKIQKGVYSDTTSFYLFGSNLDLDGLILKVTKGLDRTKDVVIIASLDGSDFRYFGKPADLQVLRSFLPVSK